jgi:queuine tRNA-ribosyltransferase
MLEFTLLKKDTSGLSHARRGRLKLNHGTIETPIFMPVGTYGSVKAMDPNELKQVGSQIILGNTFHLWLRPGTAVMDKFGGLHGFMGWDKPILTDSGGFQVFSLGAMRKITEEGVKFASPIDGSRQFLSPEISMQIQRSLNSDIVMQFDECTPYEIDGRPATTEEAAKSMRMSLRWAQRSMNEFNKGENPNALFGIVQGGMYERLPGPGDRRPVGGRAEGRHDAHPRARRPAPAREQAALPDGRRYAGRPGGRRGQWRRHVRLRDADPQRAQRLAVHPLRRPEDQERALQG